MRFAISSRTSASASSKCSASLDTTLSTPTGSAARTIGATAIERTPARRHASLSTRGSVSVSRQSKGMPTRRQRPERLLSMSERDPSASVLNPLTARWTMTFRSASSTAAPSAFVTVCTRSRRMPDGAVGRGCRHGVDQTLGLDHVLKQIKLGVPRDRRHACEFGRAEATLKHNFLVATAADLEKSRCRLPLGMNAEAESDREPRHPDAPDPPSSAARRPCFTTGSQRVPVPDHWPDTPTRLVAMIQRSMEEVGTARAPGGLDHSSPLEMRVD